LLDDRASARLLVVDDDDAMRRFLRRHLEEAGHAVVEAADFAAAATALVRSRFDLVLLDLHLGTRSGLDLFALPGVELPAMIVVSGDRDGAAARRARAAGACDFVQKPVTGVALRDRVRRALSAAHRPPAPHPA
jgi:DNA-binding response OmpR family regulator